MKAMVTRFRFLWLSYCKIGLPVASMLSSESGGGGGGGGGQCKQCTIYESTFVAISKESLYNTLNRKLSFICIKNGVCASLHSLAVLLGQRLCFAP